jgi:cytochrome P450
MLAYMRDLLAARREHPNDDAVGFLLEQTLDGEPIDDEELAKMLFLLMIAGIDTTWSSIGASMLHLATHPEDRRRLVADPGLIPTATEEFLRVYAPVFIGRIATHDTEVGGCPVAEGDWVMLGFPSANRDPEAFDRPDEVLIDRERNRHAAFGLGVHRCLGSNLARLEMNIALEMWLERYPEFELVDPDDVAWSAGQVRGPRRIRARLNSGNS